MNDERLNRHIRQENLSLKSENSKLKEQMESAEKNLARKDEEVLRLLNQIASDMVKRSDVDEIVRKAVSEEHDRMVSLYEEKMKAMAAEYEAKIASLKKKNRNKGSNGGGNAGRGKKKDTVICNTREEALAILEEEHKKLMSMTDQAFGKGNEKLTSEQKPSVDPKAEDADDDSKVQAPIEPRGNYGIADYEPTPRPEEYCQYGDVFTTDEQGNKHLRTRYFWGVRTSKTSLVYFMYDKGSRSREVIVKFLQDFIGTIQTDGATMYKIFEKHPDLGILRLSCLVHIRRYFYKALKFEDETGISRWFLDMIKLIYKFEKQYKTDRLSAETIKANREKDILPILGDILQKLTYYANNATGKCGQLLLKAIHYAQAEWQGLVHYTTDGNYRADNNYAEQVMRDLAKGRKNFLFSGSDEAAKNLSFAYSLTQSCKLCSINPYDYWEDLLANAKDPNRTIDSFMPHLWHKA